MHQVRFAVHQPNGKTGTVVADVEVPDFTRRPVMLSGVLLASARTATDQALLTDARLRALLGGDPTARRRFSRDDVVTAFAEVYVNGEAVSSDVTVSATLTTETGQTARSVPGLAKQPYPSRVPVVDHRARRHGLTPGGQPCNTSTSNTGNGPVPSDGSTGR